MTKLKWALGSLLLVSVVVTLYAQEAQQINRPLVVTQGGVTISRGYVYSGGGITKDFRTNTADNTSGNATYTAAEVIAGYISRTPNPGGNVTDALPTAALLAAAIPGITTLTGTTFTIIVDPGSSPGGTITLNGGATGVTYAGDCASSSSEKVITVWINFTSATAYRAVCSLSS